MKRLAYLFAMPALLNDDWKIVTRTGDSTLTEYFKGPLRRMDSSPASTTVIDSEHRRQVNWRNDLRQYEIVEWPPTVQPNLLPGTVVKIERRTSDTGERKRFFGHTARHLVSRVTRSDGTQTLIDGWYIEAPGLASGKSGPGGYFAILTLGVAGQSPPRIELEQVGPAPVGFAVWQKMTSTVVLLGNVRHYESVSEVTELSERVLPDTVFEPPSGYRRVTNLPYAASRPVPRTWAELIRESWQKITGWFSARFSLLLVGRGAGPIPIVLSTDEVRRLIDAAPNLRYRTILMTLHATGMRRAELCQLRPSISTRSA